jgi:gamma-glutamyl-gamma-aminobutyrate hydrolase PuuD
VSAPRIAVSGVLRSWDGADRTGVNAAYVRSVLAAGGVPIILSPLMGATYAMRALDGADGLVLTGGEDMDPAWYGAEPSPAANPPSRERDLFELALFACARQRELPILGVCRGIQVINVALGGTLFQDLPSERPGPVDHNAPGPRNGRSRRRGARRRNRLGEFVPPSGGARSRPRAGGQRVDR